MTDEQATQIIALLTEIRDRLPEQSSRPSPTNPSICGYMRGSGQPPSETQYWFARAFLEGRLDGGSNQMMPAAAWGLAREIVDRYDSNPCDCLVERQSRWDPVLDRQICDLCRRPIPRPS